MYNPYHSTAELCMNNTAIQIAFSTLLFAKLWLRSEEGEADYSNMEVVKVARITLILNINDLFWHNFVSCVKSLA